jgi:hypothetical protein
MKFLSNLENIAITKNGIHYATHTRKISYPDEGNDNYMQIEDRSFWFKHRNNIIIEAVKEFSPNKPFFDIGGGNGYVSKGLQDEGITSILIEPGENGALNAKKRGLNHIICATFEDTGFKPNTIPSVGLFDVVEHIEDDLKFLANIYNYMSKNGVIYITVPAYNKLWSNEDLDAGHFRRYTLKQIEKVAQQAGFKTLYSTYFFSLLPIPIYFFRTIPSKLGLNSKSNNLKKHQKEHNQKKGILGNLMNKIWLWEQEKIKSRERIPIGSSCFFIGKK